MAVFPCRTDRFYMWPRLAWINRWRQRISAPLEWGCYSCISCVLYGWGSLPLRRASVIDVLHSFFISLFDVCVSSAAWPRRGTVQSCHAVTLARSVTQSLTHWNRPATVLSWCVCVGWCLRLCVIFMCVCNVNEYIEPVRLHLRLHIAHAPILKMVQTHFWFSMFLNLT